jgi:MFS family permease
MIKNAGLTDVKKQLLLNVINPIFSLLAGVYGATLLDKLSRRKMLIGGLVGGLFAYVLLAAFTANASPGNNLAYGTIVSIYLFGIFFSLGYTPLQSLYSVEVLENRTRAKGSGLYFLFQNVAIVVNTYGISVGIAKIGWRLYLLYIGWICVGTVIVYV